MLYGIKFMFSFLFKGYYYLFQRQKEKIEINKIEKKFSSNWIDFIFAK